MPDASFSTTCSFASNPRAAELASSAAAFASAFTTSDLFVRMEQEVDARFASSFTVTSDYLASSRYRR